MCHGAPMARKSSSPVKRWNWRQRRHSPVRMRYGTTAATKKTGAMSPLARSAERERGIGEIEARGFAIFDAGEEAVEREQQEKGEERFRNEGAREEEDADRGEHGQGGVEGGAVAPGAAAPRSMR